MKKCDKQEVSIEKNNVKARALLSVFGRAQSHTPISPNIGLKKFSKKLILQISVDEKFPK